MIAIFWASRKRSALLWPVACNPASEWRSWVGVVYSPRHLGAVLPSGALDTHDHRSSHAGAGGGFGRSSAISRKISWNICRGMATSAIWKAMLRPWLTTLAPILINFSFKLVSDRSLIGSGVAGVRRKLPRL